MVVEIDFFTRRLLYQKKIVNIYFLWKYKIFIFRLIRRDSQPRLRQHRTGLRHDELGKRQSENKYD